jgi:hypothetical protein
MSATFQTKTQYDVKSTRTVQGSLNDAPPTLQTKSGPSGSPAGGAGSTTVYVNSTEDVSVGQTVVINPPSKSNINSTQNPTDTEAGTIAAITCGVSLTLQNPLVHTHQSGEQIVPRWSFMNVNAYTDLVFGGLAFQDPNAQKPPPPVAVLCKTKLGEATPDQIGSGLQSTIDSLNKMKAPTSNS